MRISCSLFVQIKGGGIIEDNACATVKVDAWVTLSAKDAKFVNMFWLQDRDSKKTVGRLRPPPDKKRSDERTTSTTYRLVANGDVADGEDEEGEDKGSTLITSFGHYCVVPRFTNEAKGKPIVFKGSTDYRKTVPDQEDEFSIDPGEDLKGTGPCVSPNAVVWHCVHPHALVQRTGKSDALSNVPRRCLLLDCAPIVARDVGKGHYCLIESNKERREAFERKTVRLHNPSQESLPCCRCAATAIMFPLHLGHLEGE